MPLYDYECPACSTVKEVQHSVSEIGKIEILCDDCNTQMKKMLSLPALIGFDSVGRSRGRRDKEEPTTSGSQNSGSQNTGSQNTGSQNSGSQNSGSQNSGSQKSESQKKEPASKTTPKTDSQT
jgi:putative FmdB family regulatory protein